MIMKKLFPVIFILALISCKKPPVNNNENADVIYELQTNVTGFKDLQYGKFYSLTTGVSGVALQDWTIAGTGIFTQTESIRKGFVAEVFATHRTSADWSLKIRSANGTVLKTAVPTFSIDSNYYYARATVAVQ